MTTMALSEMKFVALLRRRAEQLVDLASITTDSHVRTLSLQFAKEMEKEADRLEQIAAKQSEI
jgi:hypothetical protein